MCFPAGVDHEIFCNECDQEGKNTWPEACIDAPGVDRAKIHESIGNAALKFFDTSLNVARDGQERQLVSRLIMTSRS
jgi:hypothetical protein